MYGDTLTTKERIKNRLDLTAASFDTFIDNLILAVTARIEQMTNRRFAYATYTSELHDGSDTGGSCRIYLILKNAPVSTVATIEYKAGTTTTPSWTTLGQDYYEIDYDAGIVYVHGGLPRGFRNIRVSYSGGYNGYSYGISSKWNFNITPTGAVNGSNLTFTLPENADQVIVYADGVREQTSNVTHTNGTATFTLTAGRAPGSTIAVDYVTTSGASSGDVSLPADIVEVCEEAVARMFNKRNSEGRDMEVFQESKIQWALSVFTDENLATIRNYRRGYHL